jgi:hypothetical protein
MVIFNSYVKIPEGIHQSLPALRVSRRSVWAVPSPSTTRAPWRRVALRGAIRPLPPLRTARTGLGWSLNVELPKLASKFFIFFICSFHMFVSVLFKADKAAENRNLQTLHWKYPGHSIEGKSQNPASPRKHNGFNGSILTVSNNI